MITPAYAQTMAAYNTEMNRRIYGAALRLPDEERRADRGLFWRSIHGTLNHVLWGDRVSLKRLGAGEGSTAPVAESDRLFDGFDDLWSARQALDAEIATWAEALAPVDLDGDLDWWSVSMDRQMVTPRAILVMQLFNHQTHHRGQVHDMLSQTAVPPPVLDLHRVLKPDPD
jgi:uncharacterized damage-inducible protein DinB